MYVYKTVYNFLYDVGRPLKCRYHEWEQLSQSNPSMNLFTLSPDRGNKSSFQMRYFLDTEQEIKFSSQVIISGNLNVHTEHAQVILACWIICMYMGHSQGAGRCWASAPSLYRGDWSKRKYFFLVIKLCDAW